MKNLFSYCLSTFQDFVGINFHERPQNSTFQVTKIVLVLYHYHYNDPSTPIASKIKFTGPGTYVGWGCNQVGSFLFRYVVGIFLKFYRRARTYFHRSKIPIPGAWPGEFCSLPYFTNLCQRTALGVF